MCTQKTNMQTLFSSMTMLMAALVCLLASPQAQAHPERAKAKSAQAVRCTMGYTHCVLSCNKQAVTYAQKAQGAATVQAKARWQKALSGAQTTCIPQCYRVHCLGQAPTLAKKTLSRRVARK